MGEPLLTFKRGALVHFALDEDNASMTTRLQDGRTQFLPFNRGRDGGAGNPEVAGDFRVAYLYRAGEWGEAIFSRPVLLDIVGQFMHLQKHGKTEVLIFPRFHQLDAVHKLIAHAGEHGTGHGYLIQHSTGSGKSNTIGWLSHHAIKLHDADDKPVFNTAIVVTNRVVLDRQLQAAVSQFEQMQGVVRRIDGTSRQLKDAISKRARIIVTTLQKFSTDHLQELSGQGDRNFAVIIDEAHSSQSGRSAQSMTDVLAREEVTSDDIEGMIADHQKSRGPQANISFFAFTATPRKVTLERFGVKDADGLLHPFHLYSMRQAIEENFILDVLQNYMTYESYYQLEKAVEDDPELSQKRAQRRVARYASLHPTAIGQKVEIIVEHYRRHVEHLLEGHARAMVVTQSREHALRYYSAIGKYIQNQGYGDRKALVAFSGELDYEGETYTEANLNDFAETELPGRFDGFTPDGTPYPEQYRILIVTRKYETGFDQPKLCAMYIDRKLAGLHAVQTLSRLNRTLTGKDQTFVLDFQNRIEDIRNAFQPYYERANLEFSSDPNLAYELEERLFSFGYLDRDEIERFSQIYFRGPPDDSGRVRLERLVRQAVARFEVDEHEGRQEEFRQLFRNFLRFYTFIAQVIRLDDTSLEKLHAYGSWLSRLLPNREIPPEIEVTDDMLRLQAFKISKTEEGQASLFPRDGTGLQPVRGFGARHHTEDERKSLSEIVQVFNDRHGTEFTEADMLRFEQVNREIMTDNLAATLRNNPPDVVYSAFAEKFFRGTIRIFRRDNEMRHLVLEDKEVREKTTRYFFHQALNQVRGTAHG